MSARRRSAAPVRYAYAVGAAIAASLGASAHAALTVFESDESAALAGACVIPYAPPEPEFGFDVLDPEMIDATAAEALRTDDGNVRLRGEVRLKRGFTRLRANEVRYNAIDQMANADGEVELWRDGAYVSAESGSVSLADRSAKLPNAKFALEAERARGEARLLSLMDDGEERVSARLDDALYTTCEPGDMSWALRASSVDLDQATATGTARNVRVELGGVPVFYTPWLAFPLGDQRRSGVLVPTVRVSGDVGLDLTVPFYLNIAPEQDATVSLRTMTRRGVQLAGEYRYLSALGEGSAAVEWLPHDRRFGGRRVGASFEHGGPLTDNWRSDVEFAWVSDRDYLSDLGTTLAGTSTDYLDQVATVSYNGDSFDAFIRAQAFQVLDEDVADDNRPYKRLPQVHVASRLPERNFALNFGAFADVTHFDRRDGVTGVRAHVEPHVSFPMRTPGAFLVPRVSLAATQYALDDQPVGDDDSPSRLLPRVSVDGGLVFERAITLASKRYTQTLEPRVFYVYTPRENQDDLPIFDSTEFTNTFAQLFRDNRFAGLDRIGDDHRVSIALSSALLDRSGTERARFSFGQIRFLRDRDVQLAQGMRDGDRSSDLFTQLDLRLANDWRAGYELAFDASEGDTTRHVLRAGYRGSGGRVLNLGYRYVREGRVLPVESIEQADVSMAWPVRHDLRAVGRINYSLRGDGDLVDAFAGLEYENCCLAARAVYRRHLSDEDEYSNALMFQLELRGLSGIGRGTEAFVTRSIPGYRNDF